MKFFIKPTSITSNDFKLSLIKDKGLAKKSCYCGRLDPMARGKMLFLENNECKKMDNYLSSDKIYEFELIQGISTDTDDILGLIQNYNFGDISNFNLYDKLIEYKNTMTQQKFHK